MIEQQTGIGRNSQLILQQEALWKDVGKYPSTSIDNPLYLFNRENNNVQYVKETGIRKTSNLFFCIFPKLRVLTQIFDNFHLDLTLLKLHVLKLRKFILQILFFYMQNLLSNLSCFRVLGTFEMKYFFRFHYLY